MVKFEINVLPREELAELLDLIPFDGTNPITRAELEAKTPHNDRAIRNAIHELRSTGQAFIISGHKGYFRVSPDEVEKLRLYYRREMKRISSMYEAVKPIEDFLMSIGEINKKTTSAATDMAK